MRDLKETFLTELRIPDINGDRCVHAHIETASCKACVDACPENAWILDDESLGLNTDACDGCGLCVPACTEGAITQVQDFSIREENSPDTKHKNLKKQGENKRKALLLGCDQTGLDETNCKCVNAFTYNELLKLYMDGIQHIFVKTGDCDQCPRGKNERLEKRIENINSMLFSRQFPIFSFKKLPTSLWKELWKTPEKSAPGPEMTRRSFFRSAVKQTIEKVMHHSSFVSNAEFIPIGKILPTSVSFVDTKEPVFPYVPVINTTKCNGCDACVKACPHNALQLLADSQISYHIDVNACTACNICVDICDQDAVQVLHWHTNSKASIPLETQRCKSCGVSFHYPHEQLTNTKDGSDDKENKRYQCNICSQINHQKNLFQVMS